MSGGQTLEVRKKTTTFHHSEGTFDRSVTSESAYAKVFCPVIYFYIL